MQEEKFENEATATTTRKAVSPILGVSCRAMPCHFVLYLVFVFFSGVEQSNERMKERSNTNYGMETARKAKHNVIYSNNALLCAV
jgi:hypothetical protein